MNVMDQAKEAMEYIAKMSSGLYRDYTTWIQRNPGRASDIESAVKIVSYLLQGRLKTSSSILPELLYCSSNLLTFWHDSLLKAEAERVQNTKRTLGLPGRNGYKSEGHVRTYTECKRSKQIHRIKSLLTILEYFEFFLEVSAKQLWGDVGRWIVILIIQAVKTCLRTVLFYGFKVGMIESPALQPYDRRGNRREETNDSSSPSVVFVLKHTGRVVRKIHASPAISSRNWKVPSVSNPLNIPLDLPPLRFIAEVIHILRPLSHLISLGIWGTQSWKPWLVSLAMDISSLHLHGGPQRLRVSEKAELTRRTYALFFYLIRSPFYDRFTKRRLLNFLMIFGNRIPVLGSLSKMLAAAIPEWQDTYCYVWNDI